MYKTILLVVAAIAIFSNGEAQSLYMPRNVKEAFQKGTRSMDGRPGKNYWQNYGRYDISVSVAPPGRMIKGSEQISYINRSPDTLKEIVIRLVMNFHKPEAVHYGEMDSSLFTSGVHIDRFAVNGAEQRWEDPRGHFTWQNVRLPEPLLPGDSIRLAIDWHQDIAQRSGREGRIDSTTFYLAYFYPRVSVYDDYNGWDRLDFTGYQEFYNDFNDYTLKVTAPRNFMVWATGTLQNPREVLGPQYAGRLKESMTSDEVIHVVTPMDIEYKRITPPNEQNTWVWKADDVTDVAFAVSDHYVWDASSVVVDKATGRRASMQAAYNDTAKDFHYAVQFGREALSWLSTNWPGVPYPYPKMTAVQGYADMEYPMMVNDGSTRDTVFSRLVENHEIAHTYFPFYMGTNESRYAFMDEGWATTFELLIGRVQNSVEQADKFYKAFRVNRWTHDPSQEEDLPIITPANVLRGVAYGNNAYGKPSLGYLAVKDMLGDALFKKCLHVYMDRWHGRHPIPWDFFNSFNDAAGKNLNWFWNNWFFSNGYIDLGIQKVTRTANGYTVVIRNTGGFDAPFNLMISYADGSRDEIHKTAETWQRNQKEAVVHLAAKKKISSIRLDGGIFMDANESDNTWEAK